MIVVDKLLRYGIYQDLEVCPFSVFFCLLFVMYPGTPTTSSDESTRGCNAETSERGFGMTPPRETLTQSVSGQTTAHNVSDEVQAITMPLAGDSIMQELQEVRPSTANVGSTLRMYPGTPTTNFDETTRGCNAETSNRCFGMTSLRETLTQSVSGQTTIVPPSTPPSTAAYQTVDIPEFDPVRENKEMPSWMRYIPSSQDGAKKHRCIICKTFVGSEPESAKTHESGKKHKKNLKEMSYRLHETVQNLTTLVRQRFDLELRMFTNKNISMMPGVLSSMSLTNDDIVSFGYLIEDGHIRCLCLVTKTLCVNIDRTILVQEDKLRRMVEFKKLFEGQCIIGVSNLWELVLVLFHRYGIRIRTSVDVDDGSGNGVGVDLPLENYKLHTQVALEAVKCYDLIDARETKLRNYHLIPDRVLQHLCTLNMHLYGVYHEVRSTNYDVVWSNFSVENDGMVVKLKCDDFQSRIRKNSVIQFHSGSRVITGRCLEWDGGKLVKIHLESSLDGGEIERIVLNRREEDNVMRMLLRNYVDRLGSKDFTANRFQKHMYRLETLGMEEKQEKEYKKLLSKSPRLNHLQNIAMLRSLYPISMIHGPPGTGKTRVLSEIVKNAVAKGEGVICLGPTNVSVRRLCESLREVLPSDTVGIMTSREYKCWHQSEYEHLKDVEVKNTSRQVLCMTVTNYLLQTMSATTCDMWCASKHHPTLLTQRAVMLGDEASQLWMMVALFLFSRVSRYKSIIFGGDDIQLDPYLHKDIADAPSVMTWIRKLSGVFRIPITKLIRQYRMMPLVGTLVSENFYDNTLVHHKLSDGKDHLFFHCMEGKMSKKGDSSYCERDSIKCIEILKRYRGSGLDCHVLTFYEAQRSHLKSIDGNVNVCCIDSFQGQEADVIILLLSVRKRKLSPFMLNRGRLCVGTSRARKDFHIVGDWGTMCANDTWEKLLSRCRRVYC